MDSISQIPEGATLTIRGAEQIHWTIGPKLGEGASSSVYSVEPKGGKLPSGTSVPNAVAKIYHNPDHCPVLHHEIGVLVRSKLKFLPTIYAHSIDAEVTRLGSSSSFTKLPCVVMQRFMGLSLEQRLQTEAPPSPAEAIVFLDRIVDILKALHTHDPVLVHRDLKPGNLIPSQDLAADVHLIDVNSMMKAGREPSPYAMGGTPLFRPADISMAARVTPVVDVYAFAVIALLTLHWRPSSSVELPSMASGRMYPEELDDLVNTLPEWVNRRIRHVIRSCLGRQLGDGNALSATWQSGRATYFVPGPGAKGPKRDVFDTIFSLACNSENSIVAEGGRTLLQEVAHCATALEVELKNVVTERLERGTSDDLPDLLILSGHAGDGKSHLISRIVSHVQSRGFTGRTDALYDATHAPNRNTPSAQALASFFGRFEADSKRQKIYLAALNTGVAHSFFESSSGKPYRKRLRPPIEGQLGFVEYASAKDKSRVWVVDLDLQRIVNSPGEVGRLFELMLAKLDPELGSRGAGSVFDQVLPCGECPARRTCPTRLNLWLLREDAVRMKLNELLYAIWLEGRVHITPRWLWDFLSLLVAGRRGQGPIDSCQKALDRRDNPTGRAYYEALLPNRLFSNDAANPIFGALRRYDPVLNPRIEDALFSVRFERQTTVPLDASELGQIGIALEHWAASTGVLSGLLNRRGDNEDSLRLDTLQRLHFLGSNRAPAPLDLLDTADAFNERVAAPLAAELAPDIALTRGAEQCLIQLFGKEISGAKYLEREITVGQSRAGILVPLTEITFEEAPLLDADRRRIQPRLRDALGYRPRAVRWRIEGGPTLTIDVEMFRLMLRAQQGYKPTPVDLNRLSSLRCLRGRITVPWTQHALIEIDSMLLEFSTYGHDCSTFKIKHLGGEGAQ